MRKILVLACVFLFFAASSWALPYNTRPVAFGPGTPGEASLQTVLNDLLDPDINAVTDQHEAALWTMSEAAVDSYRLSFLAGSGGTLGIYSYATGAEVDLVTRAAGVDAASMNPLPASFLINSSGTLFADGNAPVVGFGEVFGFYWRGNGVTRYTEDSESGGAYALAYLIGEDTDVTVPGFGEVTALGNNDWVLAFEDGTDGDFQDAVFYIEDMAPVPEPGTLLLLGGGLVGLAYLRKRKKA